MRKVDSKVRLIFLAHSIFWVGQKLVQPFLSIFLINELEGVTLTRIGVATLIFYLTAGTAEPIFGYLEEKKKGLNDEAMFVFGGYLLRGFSFILFMFSSNYWHLYLFYFVIGVAFSMYSASEKTIFANISRKRGRSGAFLWGADDSVIMFSSALGALLGGHLTETYGIRLFIGVTGVFIIVAGLVYYMVLRKLKKDKIWKGF
ncbi:MFS transporter [Patescibacteria group bacterium]